MLEMFEIEARVAGFMLAYWTLVIAIFAIIALAVRWQADRRQKRGR